MHHRLTSPLALAGLAALLALAAVAACTDAPRAEPELVLRAYDVPAAHAQEVRNIVSSLLYRGDNQPRGGNVVVAPTGQLLVSAPASFHAGVARLAGEIAQKPPAAPAPIAIEYWVLQGLPSTSPGLAAGVPADARAALQGLGADTLAVTVWDHSRLVSLANERSQVQRRGAKIEQNAALHGDAVVADLRLETDVGRLDVRTALPLGKTLVLAQAANVDAGSETANGSIFYVVRASLAQ